MHPQTIRKIDYWFGQPLCWFLTLVKKIAHSSTNKPEVKRIVFLKFIEQGATVIAHSAIKRAIEIVGKENVYFCVFENNRPILDIMNLLPTENIISLNDKNLFGFIANALSALLKIRSKKIDTVIDMEFFSRASAIFSFLTGATTRVGLHRFSSEQPYRGDLMTHRIQYNPYLHVAIFYRQLVEAALSNPLEVPMMKVPREKSSIPLPSFVPSPEEVKSISEKLRTAFPSISFEGQSNSLILLNPNASDMLPLRKWETDKFIALGKKIIAENSNAYLIITGSPSEQNDADKICNQIDSSRVASFAGKTNLQELLTLYSFSKILITNDSGPGHFSSLTKIRTIVLFGPETPQLFGPISPNAHVIWKELACSPCVSVLNHRFSSCNNNVCMKSITVDEVYAVFKTLL